MRVFVCDAEGVSGLVSLSPKGGGLPSLSKERRQSGGRRPQGFRLFGWLGDETTSPGVGAEGV